jgi:hypothetical protein
MLLRAKQEHVRFHVMLEDRLKEDLKNAMRSGDRITLSALRLAISEINNKKIEHRADKLDDDAVVKTLQKMAKKHDESIAQFKKGRRDDLAEKEAAEKAVLEKYLPEAMPVEEVEKLIDRVIQETGASGMSDMGRVMSSVMGKVSGRAEGSLVSRIVKEKLA